MTDPALGLSLFAPITLSGVERIEVIRGAHSPLYGSSASGGVINIITKKGKGDFQIRFLGEADYQTIYDGNISIGGRTGVFSYYADYQTIRSDGQHDNDNYKNNTFNIKCDFDFSEKTALHLSMHYIDSLVGIPVEVFFGEVNRDINSKQSDLSFFGSATLETELIRNVDSRFSFSFITHNQNFQDPADPGEEFAWPVDYKTETVSYSFNFSNSIKLGKSNTLLFGVESRNMSATSTDKLFNVVNYDDDFNLFGMYIQNRLDIDNKFFLTASLRYDDFGDFGDNLNPRLAAAWRIAPATKLTTAFSTGFRIPSLNELYYPFYGNQNLNPEKSEGYELGIEQFLANNNLRLSFTYFSTDYTDLISYDFATFQAENISSAEARGIEFSLDFKTETGWSGALGYTYTASENLDTGERLIRLPEYQLYFTLGWKIGEYTFDILSRYVSDQLDYPVAGFPEYNEAYFVADAHIQYRMTKNVSVFLKARNLFDAEYYEVKGYKSHGRRWFIGFYFR
jgi:vitamin B12 transporter